MKPTAPSSRAAAAALILLVVAAAALRFPGLRTEPWLDEVWSITLARQAASAAGVFLRIHHDNSNPLNTLYLYLVGGQRAWAPYRLLAYVSGLLTVALLGRDREDPLRGLLAAALAAASAPMVLYATEARGYAPLALFSLACYLILRAGPAPGRARAAAFWACALAGFLFHPTFVYVFAALAAREAARLPRGRRARGLAALFGPPAAAWTVIEAIQIRGMVMGAAERDSFGSVALRALALWSGAPTAGPAAVFGATAAVALLGWELRNLRREGSDDFVFFATLFAGAAAFVAAFPFPFERHFFACLPFALLLAARALTRMIRDGGAVRAAAVAALALFMAGNVARALALNRGGRGHYLEAVRRMAADTPGDVITVSSDHDFRNKMMLDFYGDYLEPPKRLAYIPSSARGAGPAEWFLLHSFAVDARVAPIRLTVAGPVDYRLVDVYPYGGISGWTWMLYRRVKP